MANLKFWTWPGLKLFRLMVGLSIPVFGLVGVALSLKSIALFLGALNTPTPLLAAGAAFKIIVDASVALLGWVWMAVMVILWRTTRR